MQARIRVLPFCEKLLRFLDDFDFDAWELRPDNYFVDRRSLL